jgi:hypothetical protein
MRKLLLAALFCLSLSIPAQADPFVILPNGEVAFTTSFTTQGVFTCTLCTGSGTNSVVFGSGGNTLTLTFTGVNTTILVSGEAMPAIVGQIQVAASGSGFVFPLPSNPNIPVLTFSLGLTQSEPTAGTRTLNFAGFGGGTSLVLSSLFTDHFDFPILANPPGANFTAIVYSFAPFTIPNTNATVPISADVSAVPEPMSLLLLGSGAGMMLTLMRKRLSKR